MYKLYPMREEGCKWKYSRGILKKEKNSQENKKWNEKVLRGLDRWEGGIGNEATAGQW